MTAYFVHLNASMDHSYPYWNFGAAGKCHHDREYFAHQIGFVPLNIFIYQWEAEPDNVLSARLDGVLGGLERDDVVVAQWPFSDGNSRWFDMFVQRVHSFGAKLVFVIDDIAAWRTATPGEGELEREVTRIGMADALVVHSAAMYQRLVQQAQSFHVTMPSVVTAYGVSGYEMGETNVHRQLDGGIDYAGDLSQANYLEHVAADLPFNVYGVAPGDKGEAWSDAKQLRLHPRADPEAVGYILNGAFGLIWYSTSYPGVTGVLGEYMRYNTPAKLGMYLAANEPVIIWRGAAHAEFVAQQGVGIVIDQLDELPRLLANVTPADYDRLHQNAKRIGRAVRNGVFLKKALLDVLVMLADHATQGGNVWTR
ncbi:glycosyltransferase [Lacticaseibacillus pabuli]|uniref:Glycosyltransferase n=1 Tax=Lacticaseibacillus pabuli TaxID=3025672 RepID=A0ABY7WUE5_9LACO|nr:glycosyltransferase [Lacticaseibacillus sp. KACC 23028]WDF83078.1 glycosyltransferase [Lacticaseibacillus sp. KACC 23028]